MTTESGVGDGVRGGVGDGVVVISRNTAKESVLWATISMVPPPGLIAILVAPSRPVIWLSSPSRMVF